MEGKGERNSQPIPTKLEQADTSEQQTRFRFPVRQRGYSRSEPLQTRTSSSEPLQSKTSIGASTPKESNSTPQSSGFRGSVFGSRFRSSAPRQTVPIQTSIDQKPAQASPITRTVSASLPEVNTRQVVEEPQPAPQIRRGRFFFGSHSSRGGL